MYRIATAALLGLLSSAAMAMMPPGSYQAERDAATDIVVIAVDAVGAPANPDGATCPVSGTVLKVERGTQFVVGQVATFNTFCMVEFGEETPIGGWLLEYDVLKDAPFGRAYVDLARNNITVQYFIMQSADEPQPTEPY